MKCSQIKKLKNGKSYSKLVFLTLLFPFFFVTNAKSKVWSLDECIEYALSNNVDIRIQKIQCKVKDIDLNTYRNSRLPKVSSTSTQQFSFGRSLTMENIYTNTNASQSNFSISFDVPVFSGFMILNQIRMTKDLQKSEILNLDQIKNDLRLKVTDAYLQILVDKEIKNVAKRQVTIDSSQVERMKILLSHGKLSYADLSQQKATLANSKMDFTESCNNLRMAVLTICQLMELRNPVDFFIIEPQELNIENMVPANPDDVYASALNTRPEIMSKQFLIKSAVANVKIAKAALYPQISMIGEIGSNYYNVNNSHNESFGKQMENNFSQEIGLQLAIPLFNRFSTRNTIRKAKLNIENNELALEKEKITLYNEIQQAYYNALNARAKYESCRTARACAQEAFEMMTVKYECGKAIITEFNESKNRLLKSISDLIQAKYDFIYKCQLLDFYSGKNLTL